MIFPGKTPVSVSPCPCAAMIPLLWPRVPVLWAGIQSQHVAEGLLFRSPPRGMAGRMRPPPPTGGWGGRRDYQHYKWQVVGPVARVWGSRDTHLCALRATEPQWGNRTIVGQQNHSGATEPQWGNRNHSWAQNHSGATEPQWDNRTTVGQQNHSGATEPQWGNRTTVGQQNHSGATEPQWGNHSGTT
jgi:hypothetical protein